MTPLCTDPAVEALRVAWVAARRDEREAEQALAAVMGDATLVQAATEGVYRSWERTDAARDALLRALDPEDG